MQSSKLLFKKLSLLACVLMLSVPFMAARTRKAAHHATSGGKAAATSAAHGKKVSHTRSAHTKSKSKKGKAVGARAARYHGQQAIDGDRAREIQEALIRANYMKGEPSGTWDQSTRDALTRFQSDHGWQSKVVPDSRALIKLGLGPSQSNILNPETSLMSVPQATDTARQLLQPGGSTRQQ